MLADLREAFLKRSPEEDFNLNMLKCQVTRDADGAIVLKLTESDCK